MATFLLVIHIFVSFSLIFIVLIQGGKGAQMGAAFGGGSSNTVFGSRGATSFLSKATTGVAILFMLTSLLLAIANVKGKGGSIIKDTPAGTAPITQGAIPPTGAVPPAQQSSPFAPQTSPQTSPQTPANK
jgi:preprotein translocase subunit SecG